MKIVNIEESLADGKPTIFRNSKKLNKGQGPLTFEYDGSDMSLHKTPTDYGVFYFVYDDEYLLRFIRFATKYNYKIKITPYDD